MTSQLVMDEAGTGDEDAPQERLQLLAAISLLDATDHRIEVVSNSLLTARLLPDKSRSDAKHVAIATIHAVDYLLTWNCKHIANANTLPKVYRLLRELGYSPPLIVTPEEFSENV